VHNPRRVAPIDDLCSKPRGIPMRRSAKANNITPPSELMRPPSKAAVIFLRSTDGSENGSRLSSIMAGVAASDSVRGWLRHPNLSASSAAYATSASEALPCK